MCNVITTIYLPPNVGNSHFKGYGDAALGHKTQENFICISVGGLKTVI
jgi:hypothetical protein